MIGRSPSLIPGTSRVALLPVRGVGGWAAIVLAFVLAFQCVPAAAAVDLIAKIDLSRQVMTVFVGGAQRHRWPVSTGRRGFSTPVGTFRPKRLERKWFSTRYNYAPMPHSVFFHRGYAIHGTTEVKNLGRPASHGCVRLHPDHARILFGLVREHGFARTRIVIHR